MFMVLLNTVWAILVAMAMRWVPMTTTLISCLPYYDPFYDYIIEYESFGDLMFSYSVKKVAY